MIRCPPVLEAMSIHGPLQAQRGRRNPTKQLWEQANSRVSQDLPDAEAMIRDTAWSGCEAHTRPSASLSQAVSCYCPMTAL